MGLITVILFPQYMRSNTAEQLIRSGVEFCLKTFGDTEKLTGFALLGGPPPVVKETGPL